MGAGLVRISRLPEKEKLRKVLASTVHFSSRGSEGAHTCKSAETLGELGLCVSHLTGMRDLTSFRPEWHLVERQQHQYCGTRPAHHSYTVLGWSTTRSYWELSWALWVLEASPLLSTDRSKQK